ncbi:MAG TPA: dNTP triphosphohydrolase [Bryobacteraceae bacterium]|nr:dNTP triphosphohydrolase [Bryobacteraceae bacterium]
MLGHLRFPVEHSRGRRYPEPEHSYRNAFQRDRDRIVHARAFRRLEAKTQVFSPGLCDHFRNRLTHTIEVSQIARTVAATLALDEDLTEALALGHDIGHPPFSHAGEAALNSQMRRFGAAFEHNRHALRIVESFEQTYARFPGLNLTFEVREGIAKHSSDFNPGEIPELDEYLPGLRPPLEAQLIDLADEVAYNTADLDDAVSAGLIQPAEIAAEVPYYRELFETAETQFPGASTSARFHETLRRLIDGLVSGLIQGTVRRAAASRAQGVDDVRRYPQRLAAFTSETQIATCDLKQFLHRRVYSSPALCQERERAASMIAELFDFFVAHPERLPAPYCGLIPAEPAHRVVCDYIAGMTNSFFQRTYGEIFTSPPA